MEGANLLNVLLAMAASLSVTSQVTIDPNSIKVTAIYYIVQPASTLRRKLLVSGAVATECTPGHAFWKQCSYRAWQCQSCMPEARSALHLKLTTRQDSAYCMMHSCLDAAQRHHTLTQPCCMTRCAVTAKHRRQVSSFPYSTFVAKLSISAAHAAGRWRSPHNMPRQ